MSGPLVPVGDTSPIPSRNEVIKDLIKWFASNFGVDLVTDAAERLFRGIDTEELFARYRKLQAAKSGGASNGLVVLGAVLLFATSKRKRRR